MAHYSSVHPPTPTPTHTNTEPPSAALKPDGDGEYSALINYAFNVPSMDTVEIWHLLTISHSSAASCPCETLSLCTRKLAKGDLENCSEWWKKWQQFGG